MRIHVLQHVSFEGPGIIGDWANANGHEISVTRLYEEEARLPPVDSIDFLVVMGGPMGVDDGEEYPWLVPEKRLIWGAIEAERPVLGICLGAQLIASVLGARVLRNEHREIGWGSIELTEEGRAAEVFSHLPDELEVFHWHGDTFETPEGAVNLAQSAGCRNQAFLYGKSILGLQFHLEITPGDVVAMIENTEEDLTPDAYVQAPAAMIGKEDSSATTNEALRGILQKLTLQSLV